MLRFEETVANLAPTSKTPETLTGPFPEIFYTEDSKFSFLQHYASEAKIRWKIINFPI